MPLKLFNPVDEEAFDEFDLVEEGGTLQTELREDLLPRFAKRVHAATQISPVDLWFFAKKQTGRRCSCWHVFTAPRMTCRVCFGTGISGGFEKFGFREEVVDVSRQNIRLVNVMPTYDKQTAPVRFGLVKTAVSGVVEVDVPLVPNKGKLDVFQAEYSTAPGTLTRLFVRAPDDVDWVELLGAGAADLVQARLAAPLLRFRVELTRSTPTSPLPELESIYLRYQLIDDPVIHADVERTPTRLTLHELGAFLAFEERKTFLDGRLKRITTEDFFQQIDTGLRWKLIRVNEGRALGLTFEWSLNSRIVHSFPESYGLVP